MTLKRKTRNYKIITEHIYGYRRLSPIPRKTILSEFYKYKYYGLIGKNRRDAGIHRLMSGGEAAKRERQWMCATLYSDIRYLLDKYATGKRILDVGCGMGGLLFYLKQHRYDVTGVEPSDHTAASARSQNIPIYNLDFTKFIELFRSKKIEPFDAVIFIDVLEHLEDPVQIIKITKEILKPNGVICIRVPNDFSQLQISARKKLGKKSWWIAAPDHINYFNFYSLRLFLKRLGLKVMHSQSDFPMELFLLMGDDYTVDPEVGSKCHEKRVNFEMAIPQELRRCLYQALAEIGVGRLCLMLARNENRKHLKMIKAS